MNIRDLKYLVTVAKTAHFGEAAAKCFVSQPTLSMQIQKLEEELGVTVFERNNKKVLLTDAGRAIVAQAEICLQEIEKLKQISQHAQDPFSGKILLGIIPTLGPYLLPHILHAIKKQLPNLTLEITEEKTENLVRSVQQGDMDCAIIATTVNADFVVEKLFSEPFYAVVSKSHALAKEKNIKASMLSKERVLLLNEGHCFRDQALEVCRYKTKNDNDFSATSLETLCQIVGTNAGVTLIPALAITSIQKNSDVLIQPISEPIPSRQVSMIWRKSFVREICCKKLCEIISAEMQKIKSLRPDAKLKVVE